MKVLLSGGGTGGHIYPALALMRRLKEIDPTTEFLYVGTERGLESRIVPKAGVPFKSVKVEGFKRSLSLENLKTIQLFLQGIFKAKKIVKEFNPDVVIGTGGYVCGPVVYAAAKLGIPTIIHEQNSIAGVTNKFLARYVTKIATCFEEAKKEFDKYASKVVYTGNPRAQEVAGILPSDALVEYRLKPGVPTVLIFGGSRGAQAINKAFIEALPEFAKREYQVLFATGEVHYKALSEVIGQTSENVSVVPYIHNMPEIFANVSVVVSRSGATTLAELTALGLPSILIPSPMVTNDHQTSNAKSLVKHDAAKMIAETELTTPYLLQTIDEMMDYPEKRKEMASQAKKIGVPDAADRLIEVINEITSK